MKRAWKLFAVLFEKNRNYLFTDSMFIWYDKTMKCMVEVE